MLLSKPVILRSDTPAHAPRVVRELALFFGLTFGLTWSVGAGYLLAPEVMRRLIGPLTDSSVAFYVAVYAPSVFGVALTAMLGGRAALVRLLRGLSWRVAPTWIAVVFLGYPLWYVLSDTLTSAPARSMIQPLVVTYFAKLLWVWPPRLWFDPGPLGEEFGWRGYALPRLLQLMSPLSASLLLGVVWAVWHLPAYVLGAELGRSMADFPWFVLSLVATAILFTGVYRRTGANFLVGGICFHWVINACASAGLYLSAPSQALIVCAAAIAVIIVTKGRLGEYPAGTSERDRLAPVFTACVDKNDRSS